MAPVLEIIASAEDRASGVLRGIESTGKSAGQSLYTSFRRTGLALGAAGAAAEGLARNMQPVNTAVRRLGAATDMTDREVRRLAGSMVNATFPLSEVVELMEIARQRGMKTGEEMERFANFWDMVGDATGLASTQLARSSSALQAVGVAAGRESDAVAAFGFITRETTQDVGEFLQFLERAGPELREMGMNIDQTAAMLGILESRGISGRAVFRQFNEAISEANGDTRALFAALGITGDELEAMTGKVAESSEVLAENAKAYEATRTSMQRFKASIEAWKVENGEFIEGLGDASGAMIFLAGAFIAIEKAVKAAKVGLMLIKGAFIGLAAPVVAAGAVIAGWLVGVTLLFDHLINRTDSFLSQIRDLQRILTPGEWWDAIKGTVSGQRVTPRMESGVDPEERKRLFGSGGGEVSMSGMFSGANINIASQGDAEALSQQIESAVGGYLRGMGVA